MKLKLMHQSKAPTVPLTPMLDVLTVLLVFLIVHFSPSTPPIESNQVRLPESNHPLTQTPRIQVEVNSEFVKVNGSAIEGLAPSKEDPLAWEGLKSVLRNSGYTMGEPVLLVADKSTSFRFIDRTVAYLASEGYADVYLLTKNREGL